jgi:hypothetical protein
MPKKSRLPRIIVYIVLSIVITMMSVRTGMAEEPVMRLYFLVPFSIETFTPVTMENIGIQFGREVWFMEDRPFIMELVTMLKSHPTKKEIAAKGIRLKVDLGPVRGMYFVDKEGTVLKRDSKTTFQLSVEELERLERKLESFIGVVDVKAYRGHQEK